MTKRLSNTSRPVLLERRASPRLEVNGRIQGELEALQLQVRVRDIGLGGFSIETTEPVAEGPYVIRFTANDQWSVSLSARNRYCRPFSGIDGVPRYVAGFEYAAPESPETQRTIDALIERLTSVLMFE